MKQRGVSLVELMVGIVIALLVLAVGTQLFVDHLRATRRALLTARVSQDLQSIAGLITREWRRAGLDADPHSAFVTRDRSNHAGQSYEFRLREGAMQMRTTAANGSTGWQPLTDPGVLQVSVFEVELQTRRIEADDYCTCLALQRCSRDELASRADRPSVLLHRLDLHLRARARGDASIEREIRESVAVRSPQLDGTCP